MRAGQLAADTVTMITASVSRAAVPGTVAISAANGALERLVSSLAAELAHAAEYSLTAWVLRRLRIPTRARLQPQEHGG